MSTVSMSRLSQLKDKITDYSSNQTCSISIETTLILTEHLHVLVNRLTSFNSYGDATVSDLLLLVYLKK